MFLNETPELMMRDGQRLALRLVPRRDLVTRRLHPMTRTEFMRNQGTERREQLAAQDIALAAQLEKAGKLHELLTISESQPAIRFVDRHPKVRGTSACAGSREFLSPAAARAK
jgi:hypothetical protein